MERNIAAYGKAVDHLCATVLRREKVLRMAEEKTLPRTSSARAIADKFAAATANVREDPEVRKMAALVSSLERRLVSVGRELVAGRHVDKLNAIYLFAAVLYIELLVLMALLLLSVGGSDMDRASFVAFVIALLICLSLCAAVQPLIAMGHQAHDWDVFISTLSTAPRRVASKLLSEAGDADELRRSHVELRRHFVWRILGLEISRRAIVKAVTAYFAFIATTFVIPAVIVQVESLQQSAFEAAVQAATASLQPTSTDIVSTTKEVASGL